MNTRHIVVKTLLNAEEFLEFDAACKSCDTSHSKAIRDVSKAWAKNIRKAGIVERPKHVPVQPTIRHSTGFRLRQ